MPRKLFVKGQSGNPGGKPKPGGSKKKARLKVQEILDMLDFRPFEEMVALYRDVNTKARHKVEILTELCGYIAPKLKCVELSSDNENPFIINLNLQPGKKRLEFDQVAEEVIDDDDEGN
jgi:hypothetical protein